jgi:hypothetical protein
MEATHMAKPTYLQSSAIESLVVRWFEAAKADYIERYGAKNEQYCVGYERTKYTTGKNFFHLVIGSSSAFLVDIETGIIYGNKGWLRADKNKIIGNAYDPNFSATVLVRDRFRYGHFENCTDGRC